MQCHQYTRAVIKVSPSVAKQRSSPTLRSLEYQAGAVAIVTCTGRWIYNVCFDAEMDYNKAMHKCKMYGLYAIPMDKRAILMFMSIGLSNPQPEPS